MKKPEPFTFIDLFAGIGGFHHALRELGGKCVFTCEIDKNCKKVYSTSLGGGQNGHVFVENIRTLTRNDVEKESDLKNPSDVDRLVPDHDVLCAGFPCQPFSKSGRQEGFRDKTRGTLFFDICQIIEAKKPKYLFLENVRNIAGPRHQDTWEVIVSSLEALGYHVHPKPLIFSPHLIPPDLGGAPQNRDRVFIVGTRKDLGDVGVQKVSELEHLCRKKTIWNPDAWEIKKYLIPDKKIPNVENYFISKDEEMYVEAWNHLVENISVDSLPGFPIWPFAFTRHPQVDTDMPEWERNFRVKNSGFYLANKAFLDKWKAKRWGKRQLTVDEFPVSRQKLEWQAKKAHPTGAGRTLRDLVLQFRPSGIRVKPPTYLPALVAITQTSVVGPELRECSGTYRKLTPVEASRLQGLPDNVYASGLVDDQTAYRQLGNAVNAGLVGLVSSVLLERMDPATISGELV